jgi:LAO/AO transport system kinase
MGFSGSPGVGKSTLIEALGMYLIDQGHRVAVLVKKTLWLIYLSL